MKKLIDAPSEVLVDALKGVAAAHPELAVDIAHRVVARATPEPGKVALVSGGGSGHEPLHSGFVGPGMLDAACAGEVFTSPTPDQMLAAAQAVDTGAGVLFIVKNYTGDVLNFEMAAELAEAEGIAVKTVLVADDVAVEDSTWTAGRRGVGTTVLVEKIAGAAARAGADLDAVHAIAERVSEQGRSMGVALTSATLPSVGKPSFDLPEDEMEMGVGIHGEPGRTRAPLASASEIAETLVSAILADHDFTGAPVIAMLSGLGGTPLIELYLMYGAVAALLEERGITVARVLVGDYITSLDMAGCSLTLLRADDEMLRLWDAPVSTAALRWGA
ncbi:dihydroxyacetone kinase subunit DhaK [Agromyces tropicus]|uniref:Dihydroxyacetone kinase subunit DhaK n=1 Tax=Agromyces tropicus TaxID=555371 RepID=A0ABP5FX69_9MICO